MVADKMETTSRARLFANRNLLVDALIIVFGIGSWIGVSSTYLQLPIIVRTAPEGWSLASYIAVIVQSGNIALISYVLYQKYAPNKANDAYLIYIFYMIGCGAAVGMAFLYQDTYEIAGKEHSVYLIWFAFLFSMVGCISSVLFMPYIGRFRDIYMTTYMIGQGLNGFLSSILSLIQGIGGPTVCIANNSTIGPPFIKYTPEPWFSPKIFFLIIFGIIFVSGVAFVLLHKLESCKTEYVAGQILHGNEYVYDRTEKSEINGEHVPENVRNLSKFNFKFLMVTEAVICLIGNGILPGLITYSCIPYGNQTYHWANSLNSIAIPTACIGALFIPHTSIRAAKMMLVALAFVSTYLVWTALLSPNPPFADTWFGAIHIVSLTTQIYSYTKIRYKLLFNVCLFFYSTDCNLGLVQFGVQFYEIVAGQNSTLSGR